MVSSDEEINPQFYWGKKKNERSCNKKRRTLCKPRNVGNGLKIYLNKKAALKYDEISTKAYITRLREAVHVMRYDTIILQSPFQELSR